MRRLVVLADSLSFHGPTGPVPLAEPRLYPNVLAGLLADGTGDAWRADVVARAGWGVRELWYALQRDVHLQQQVLLGADAVVLGVGSSDSLSVGVPRPAMAVLPFVRPVGLRRALRRAVDRHHGRLVRLTGARIRHTPVSVYAHCWAKCADALALFAPQAARCAVLPASHAAAFYAHAHPFRGEVAALTRRLAAARDLPLVDLDALVRPHLGRMNVDGVHWSYPVHGAVAAAMASALLPGLAGGGSGREELAGD
jgi:diglucosylglycerate octanoyltransferase